jgi:hypothetical protein
MLASYWSIICRVSAETVDLIRVVGEVSEEGPHLVVVAGADGAVDEGLERVTIGLGQIDLGAGDGPGVVGAGRGAPIGRLVRVGEPVSKALPPSAGAALVDSYLLVVVDAVTKLVADNRLDGEEVVDDL